MTSQAADHSELLSNLVSHKGSSRSWLTTGLSLLIHGLVLVAIILVPIMWPDEPPGRPDLVRVLLYNPPPPPPPPLLRGRPEGSRDQQLPESDAVADEPDLTLPAEVITPQSLSKELGAELDRLGSLTGSEFGSPDGMPEGVAGGVVGGVPGGVVGGVIGGTGDGIVQDYDRGPRLIRKTQPDYPKEAFVKKIEGVVELAVVIDSRGRVSSAQVVHSIPALNASAIACVKQWIFSPAIKNGRPVATLASIPITFKIY
jgi:protein TonB